MSMRVTSLVCIAGIIMASPADGQFRNRLPKSQIAPPKRTATAPRKTKVSLTLITDGNAAGLLARFWNATLQKLAVPVRIRRGTSADKLETREASFGTYRKVMVTGKLDRRGRLVFADHTFSRSETAKLTEWIRELQTYGSQGRPGGKPLWGLSKTQFGQVHSALSRTVSKNVSGATLETGVSQLGLPRAFPLRYSVAARKRLRTSPAKIRKQVKGHSLGTSLAMILRDHGLGFRPNRTPSGAIELVVDPLTVAGDAWPVGWDLKESRPKTAPKMFRLIPVELDKVKFLDVLNAISVKTGIPIHLDYYAISAKGISPDKLVVSYARRMTSWSILLRGIASYNKLSRQLRIDEAGKPFYWISTFSAASPGK